jgi:hypothetical protein
MVCVALQDTVAYAVSVNNWQKMSLLPRWTGIINTAQSSTHAHTHTHCTQGRIQGGRGCGVQPPPLRLAVKKISACICVEIVKIKSWSRTVLKKTHANQ